jgi:uncharacterized spore protein YtfJ
MALVAVPFGPGLSRRLKMQAGQRMARWRLAGWAPAQIPHPVARSRSGSTQAPTGAARPSRQQEEALDMDVENLLAKVGDNLSVRRAFGTAYERDGMLIIPVAVVAGGGGAGTARARRGNRAAGPGRPPGEDATGHEAMPQDPDPDPGHADTGGGFGGLVLPSGAYVVRGGQVRWVPAVDGTIAVLALLSLVRVLARTWTRRRGDRGRS